MVANTTSEPLKMLTTFITPTVLTEIKVYSINFVGPPWVGTALSAVLNVIAVLTTALTIALALALVLAL